MKANIETDYCKKLFYSLGRKEKVDLLHKSNLTDRERAIIHYRLIEGLQLAEAADKLRVEYSCFVKAQKRAFIKLYSWLIVNNL
jgi:DNA-directed RNA polymerase specialized sigma subunit